MWFENAIYMEQEGRIPEVIWHEHAKIQNPTITQAPSDNGSTNRPSKTFYLAVETGSKICILGT